MQNVISKLLLFFTISLYATPSFDELEYAALMQACKSIRQHQIVINDYRMSLDDAIECAITNYLRAVNSIAALKLLGDLKEVDFKMGLR